MDFKNVLKDIRERQGLSQSELAVKLGVAQSTVAMWESGQRVPSYKRVAAILAAFGRSIDSMLLQPPTPPLPDHLVDFISEDDCMRSVGIVKGSVVSVSPSSEPNSGDIVCLSIDGAVTFRRLNFVTRELAVLTADASTPVMALDRDVFLNVLEGVVVSATVHFL